MKGALAYPVPITTTKLHMQRTLVTLVVVLLLAAFAFDPIKSANAQGMTVTTTGGTANSVPKFSGSSTIVNSAITDSSGLVGIGTTSPSGTLDVEGGTAASGNNGSNITLNPQSGNGTNKNGGSINVQVGLPTGTGTPGTVNLNGVSGTNTSLLALYNGSEAIADRGDGCCSQLIQSDNGYATHFYTYSNGTFEIHKYGTGSPGGPVFTIANSGLIGIGTTSPAVSLDLSQKTDAVALPSGNMSQRPTGINGEIRYNSATGAVEAFMGGLWTPLSGAGASINSSGQLLCGGSAPPCHSSTISYCPYKGNLKTTALYGNYTIPSGTASSGCLTATLTSMYVGGTASQSAAANTLYYVSHCSRVKVSPSRFLICRWKKGCLQFVAPAMI
jgi:hypothetical protein